MLFVKRKHKKDHFNQNVTHGLRTTNLSMIKSRMMRWAGHVARMGGIFVGMPEENISSEDLHIDARIIFK
jgi:hypothetical protein